jgi:flagellar biosynthesis GTPase FlhF
MVVVGSCCIKRFEKRRLCRTCKTPHSGTKYNQCLSCRKDDERTKKEQEKRQHEEKRRFWQEQKEKQKQAERKWFNERETERRETESKRREEEEERKKAEQRRFDDVWKTGTVRDKLNTYQLPKLHILAERKGILKYQRYERDVLIDTLLNYTTHKELPI